MRAIEFFTKTEDGYIKIPKKYCKLLKKKFRVLILLEDIDIEKKSKKTKAQKGLTAIKIKTKGLKIDREKLHKR